MWCPDELKLNKFKVVRIPSNKEYFGMFGSQIPLKQAYTGDADIKPAMTKNEQAAESIRLYNQYAEEERSKHSDD